MYVVKGLLGILVVIIFSILSCDVLFWLGEVGVVMGMFLWRCDGIYELLLRFEFFFFDCVEE